MAATSNYFATTCTHVVIVISTAATALSFAADRVATYAHNMWRRIVDELPLALLGRAPKFLPVALERIVARVCPPVVGNEPAFVGAGLAFRRWR
jgi:hypothetical protein